MIYPPQGKRIPYVCFQVFKKVGRRFGVRACCSFLPFDVTTQRRASTVARTLKLLEKPPKQATQPMEYTEQLRWEKFYRENGVFCGWCGEPRTLYAADVGSVVIGLCVECLEGFGAKLKGRRKNRTEEESST